MGEGVNSFLCFPQLLSKQTNRKPPSKRQFGKLTKSHRKFWTNWNVENLKPSVVVASCGVCWGQHQCSPEMGVMKDSALRTIFSPLRSVGVYKTYPFLCTFLAAVFNMNIFLNFEQCGVLLAWLVVIRVQFSQICFSRRGCGGGERKLGQTNRHSRHFSTQPPKPRWRTRELK